MKENNSHPDQPGEELLMGNIEDRVEWPFSPLILVEPDPIEHRWGVTLHTEIAHPVYKYQSHDEPQGNIISDLIFKLFLWNKYIPLC